MRATLHSLAFGLLFLMAACARGQSATRPDARNCAAAEELAAGVYGGVRAARLAQEEGQAVEGAARFWSIAAYGGSCAVIRLMANELDRVGLTVKAAQRYRQAQAPQTGAESSAGGSGATGADSDAPAAPPAPRSAQAGDKSGSAPPRDAWTFDARGSSGAGMTSSGPGGPEPPRALEDLKRKR